MSRTPMRALGYAAVAVVIAVAPHVIPEVKVTDSQLALVGAYAIALMGLVILTGMTGQISLGHGAFVAIGAYVTAILTVRYGVRDLLTVPLGGLVAGIVGFLFGFPALRLAGVYLALATFALAVIVPAVASSSGGFAGGTGGLLVPYPSSPVARWTPELWLYYVTWSIAVLRGKRGRALRAIRENELAATSSGISLPRYKTLAFGVSAFYAGVAGSLFAIPAFIVSPGSFPVTISIFLLVGLVVGGAGSLVGVIIGAAFFVFVPLYAGNGLGWIIDALQWVKVPVGDVDPTTPGVPSVILGLFLLLVLFAMPNGAADLARRVGSVTKQVYSRLNPAGRVTSQGENA